MSLDSDLVDAAIEKVLANGEEWRMGDVSRRLGLNRLLELRDKLLAEEAQAAGNTGVFVVQFQNPTTVDTG
jgi:hypothetical protein